MRGKTCCVTGHRDIPADRIGLVKEKLRNAILVAIEDGYTHFISGFATGADLMFAEIIAELKGPYLITLEAAIPYFGRLKTPDKIFQKLIGCCDIVKVHSDQYSKDCYVLRNRYMVDSSGLVIAVFDGRQTGGTAASLMYAKSRGLQVVFIN